MMGRLPPSPLRGYGAQESGPNARSSAYAAARAAADLLVPESIRRTVEPAHVHVRGLLPPAAAARDDAVAGLERVAAHADAFQLEAVVHLEAPLLDGAAAAFHVHHHERM